MKEETVNVVKNELSGGNAKTYVAQISRFHRIQASPMFHEAAQYVKKTLDNIGFKAAKIEQYTSDGDKKYWTWTSPLGWEVKSAELSLVEPEAKLIVRYKDVPTCLHTHSKATPPEGVTAELVDVGEGTKPIHYKDQSISGKFVLATGRAREVHEQAVCRFGAAGVITDSLTYEIKTVRESLDIPDAHAYQSIWPTKKNVETIKFGFSLSKRQGNHLRALLGRKQKVLLNARVSARLFPSHLDVVTATIRGESKPDEEIFLIAHLCHPKPSANDNASGSGLLLEIARTIQTLIRSGNLQNPSRTIRFLWVPETLGTIAHLYHHQEWPSKLVAGINLDMVGQNQALCKSTLNLDKTPDSNPSYLNDFVFNLIKQSVEVFGSESPFGQTSTFRYDANPFSGGSDHAEFNDSTFKVPCVMLIQWPDLFYHSSADEIDKVSEDSLKRVGWIATVAALTLANATADDAILIANLARWGGITRLQETVKEATTALFQKINAPDKNNLQKELRKITLAFRDRMNHITRREKDAINSVTRLVKNPELEELLKKSASDIERYSQLETRRYEETLACVAETTDVVSSTHAETESAKKARSLVPKRLFKETLSSETFKETLGEKAYEWYDEILEKDKNFKKKIYEILNFMNGERTIYDITKAVTAEYDETNLEHVLKFIQDLEKINLVSSQILQ
ncbi:MAG: DUF4910 domain-containing protein [Candidatus Bathyarchaeota archaeon]|nr:DUF4910 domain-containing protein [Candidatus Bathyarchaeota archaeon]